MMHEVHVTRPVLLHLQHTGLKCPLLPDVDMGVVICRMKAHMALHTEQHAKDDEIVLYSVEVSSIDMKGSAKPNGNISGTQPAKKKVHKHSVTAGEPKKTGVAYTLMMDLVPSEIVCLESSTGKIRQTVVWISHEKIVNFLEYTANSDTLVRPTSDYYMR